MSFFVNSDNLVLLSVKTSDDGSRSMSDVLVVASKIKALIKKESEMNTAASVMDALSKVVEREIKKAIERAKTEKRKTVMDRDFE